MELISQIFTKHIDRVSWSKYLHNESIQRYLRSNSRTTCIASLKVFGNLSSAIPDLNPSKESLQSFKKRDLPQQGLIVVKDSLEWAF